MCIDISFFFSSVVGGPCYRTGSNYVRQGQSGSANSINEICTAIFKDFKKVASVPFLDPDTCRKPLADLKLTLKPTRLPSRPVALAAKGPMGLDLVFVGRDVLV